MKVKCIKLTPKNTYGKYDDITIGKVYEAFKDSDFLIVEDDKGDLWDYEAELFEEVEEEEGEKINIKCIKLRPCFSSVTYKGLTIGKVYEAVVNEGSYKIVDDFGYVLNYESELFELVKKNEGDETYIMDFIKTNKLDYFTGNVIKCMIKFKQTQDKQYLADSLKFIEAMV